MLDALVQVAKPSDLQLDYSSQEPMDSHVIDAVNRHSRWWYRTQYSGMWMEANAICMTSTLARTAPNCGYTGRAMPNSMPSTRVRGKRSTGLPVIEGSPSCHITIGGP